MESVGGQDRMCFCRHADCRRLSVRTLLVAAALAVAVTGCARPKGDFGRAVRSTIHDDLMPSMGASSARERGEPVSKFNLTNDERVLRDRSWAIVSPPHSRDWHGAEKAELQRTRIYGEVDRTLDPGNYYELLRTDKYRSSDARYDRVINDINSDIALVEPFHVVLRRVLAADAERLRVVRASLTAIPEDRKNAFARVDENKKLQNWVCRSLMFRLSAYRHAIDRLEIETPSDRLFDANRAWRHLAAAIKAAQDASAASPVRLSAEPRKSRIASGWGMDDTVPQK